MIASAKRTIASENGFGSYLCVLRKKRSYKSINDTWWNGKLISNGSRLKWKRNERNKLRWWGREAKEGRGEKKVWTLTTRQKKMREWDADVTWRHGFRSFLRSLRSFDSLELKNSSRGLRIESAVSWPESSLSPFVTPMWTRSLFMTSFPGRIIQPFTKLLLCVLSRCNRHSDINLMFLTLI